MQWFLMRSVLSAGLALSEDLDAAPWPYGVVSVLSCSSVCLVAAVCVHSTGCRCLFATLCMRCGSAWRVRVFLQGQIRRGRAELPPRTDRERVHGVEGPHGPLSQGEWRERHRGPGGHRFFSGKLANRSLIVCFHLLVLAWA